MLVAAGGLAGTYYVMATRSQAQAATRNEPAAVTAGEAKGDGTISKALLAVPKHKVVLQTSVGHIELTWEELGVAVDAEEVAKVGPSQTDAEIAALEKKGSLPVHLDPSKASAKLLAVRGSFERAPIDAYLDLEAKVIHDDTPGHGLDVYGSLPRLEAAARTGADKVDLVDVAIPAAKTKAGLGIDDISQVLGHYKTTFPVGDRDRNFNLKLAASKLNGVVMQPGVEFSFNDTVGERSELAGYKVAHVISAGEMIDGLAGGTCQISTTLFGASFFAGIDIVKTTNHSRPSAYTPLGFDATVVWPNTDLKLKNPYDFPVAIHYRVANGEAVVEILGKKRPYDQVTFERHVYKTEEFKTEERPDETMPEGTETYDQKGLQGYSLTRIRRFYIGGKEVKSDKWNVTYEPVTEYIRKGTGTDPDLKQPTQRDIHELHPEDTASTLSQ